MWSARPAAVRWLPIARLAAALRPRWLRGDIVAGVAVTALIVPKNLGYAGIAGVPAAERAVRGRGRARSLRALLHVAADLDGAELVARRRRGRRGARHRARRRRRPRSWSRRSRSSPGLLFLLLALLRLGWIAQLPLEGGDHRVPGGRGDRRRHRRAAEAHRHVRRGRQRVARARRRGSARSATSHWTTLLVGRRRARA